VDEIRLLVQRANCVTRHGFGWRLLQW